MRLDRQHEREGPSGRDGSTQQQGRQAIGRSRGGLTTKLNAVVPEDRLPLILTLTPGHWGDAPWDRWLLEQLGPISSRPQLLADRAYEGDAMRALAAELG
ncbi:MAG: hypothetical protein OXD50_01165 [Chloroflexi bacterium]|nr:hypothetical protein [Chloroflexota bacterium]